MATTQGAQMNAFLVEPGSGASPTFDASSEIYAYLSESMAAKKANIDPNTIRGTREHFVAQTREGLINVNGSVEIVPCKDDLDLWLPRIMGAAESTDDFDYAETLPSFAMLIDKLNNVTSEFFQYTDCQVGKATFSGTAGEPLKLALDITAIKETLGVSWPGTPPTLATAAADYQPWMFHDLALTIGGNSVTCYDISIMIDNALEVKFGSGSNEAASITPVDRVVQLTCTIRWTNTQKTNIVQSAEQGRAGVATFTRGTTPADVLTATFGALQLDEKTTPTTGGKNEVTMSLTFTARQAADGTASLSFSNADG